MGFRGLGFGGFAFRVWIEGTVSGFWVEGLVASTIVLPSDLSI